jgi:hypothetical protein
MAILRGRCAFRSLTIVVDKFVPSRSTLMPKNSANLLSSLPRLVKYVSYTGALGGCTHCLSALRGYGDGIQILSRVLTAKCPPFYYWLKVLQNDYPVSLPSSWSASALIPRSWRLCSRTSLDEPSIGTEVNIRPTAPDAWLLEFLGRRAGSLGGWYEREKPGLLENIQLCNSSQTFGSWKCRGRGWEQIMRWHAVHFLQSHNGTLHWSITLF